LNNFLLQSEGEGSLAVDYFTFSSSIADHLRSASLVISHAGMLFTNFLSIFLFTNYFAIIDTLSCGFLYTTSFECLVAPKGFTQIPEYSLPPPLTANIIPKNRILSYFPLITNLVVCYQLTYRLILHFFLSYLRFSITLVILGDLSTHVAPILQFEGVSGL